MYWEYQERADNDVPRMREEFRKRLYRKEPSMTIADLITKSHTIAVEKGWWDSDRPFSEGIALMHSELSEALEEWRQHGMDTVMMIYYKESKPDKPEGIAVELADLFIRVADWCGKCNIPIENALKQKMNYNKTRSYRHGGKLA